MQTPEFQESVTEAIAKAASGNPDEWIGIDELFCEWDIWDSVKV